MSKEDLQIGQGDVTCFLDGEQVTLKPSLHAVKMLCTGDGGIGTMVQRVSMLDFNAILMVVVAGLGLSGNGTKDLPEKLYKTGLFKMSAVCIQYLNILANGGKPPKDEEEKFAQEDPQTANQ